MTPNAGAEPFDPYDLRPLASLNSRVYIGLPGMPAEWVGQKGTQLCSRATLIRLLQSQAGELGLENATEEELPRQLNDVLESSDANLRARAEAAAGLHGQRLGALLASILRSTEGLTSPLALWEAAYLRHWREQVDEIALGGGLASGRLGQCIAAAAQAALAAAGLPGLRVSTAEYPSLLALIGAARSVPPGPYRAAAVADFGGTHGKRGLAFYDPDGALERLRVLPPLATHALSGPGQAGDLAAAIVAGLAETIRVAGEETDLAPLVMCSVAAYVQDNRPALAPGREGGAYALRGLAPDPASWLAEQISTACGRPVHFQFAHDCDVAARALAGRPRCAVVMLGTALGVGFAPPAAGCRPVGEPVKIETAPR
jgi:hypothetical protein